MRRPLSRFAWLSLASLLAAGVLACSLLWLVPRYARLVAEDFLGADLDVARVCVQWPPRLTMEDVRLRSKADDAVGSAKRIVIWPGRVQWPSAVLARVRVEGGALRVTRDAAAGLRWPFRQASLLRPGRVRAAVGGWRLSIDELDIQDGALEWIDERLDPPMHVLIDHIAGAVGPLGQERPVSFALRWVIQGQAGASAPAGCAGWFHLQDGGMDLSCGLEPLELAAFGPHARRLGAAELLGTAQARLAVASRWVARAGDLSGRVDLKVDELDGVVVVKGRLLGDFRRRTNGERHLDGTVHVRGPLRQPSDWRLGFVPGNAAMKSLLQPLEEYRRESLTLRFWGQPLVFHLEEPTGPMPTLPALEPGLPNFPEPAVVPLPAP